MEGRKIRGKGQAYAGDIVVGRVIDIPNDAGGRRSEETRNFDTGGQGLRSRAGDGDLGAVRVL
jgi:hypothetical protein